jgi:fatty acid desaturase
MSSTDIEYTYEEIRKHRFYHDAWMGIHGEVYDVTKFIATHPGGNIIHTGFGRDATVLFENHHNLLPNLDKVTPLLKKYRIGKVKDYVPIANFKTPFALKMLERCREVVQGQPHRDSWFSTTSVVFFFSALTTLVYLSYVTKGSMIIAFLLGALMSLGHLQGHMGNHWGVSSHDWVNRFVSITCTSLWGLREKNWEFAHLISHHCYNYTEKDFIMEQHLPMKFFRIRSEDPWLPMHAYQHITYLLSPLFAFFIGGIRVDCAPFVFVSPILGFLKYNRESPLPAPQFTAAGSNISVEKLGTAEDGVGPSNFVVFSEKSDDVISLLISNVIWMPLFFYLWSEVGLFHATAFNFVSFGFQSCLITRSLLTQHLSEDIMLPSEYKPTDDWYAMQVEASTSVASSPLKSWLTHAIELQTEHHMFPCLNALLLRKIQCEVQRTAEEFGVHYNYFPSVGAVQKSLYKRFVKLAVKPKSA